MKVSYEQSINNVIFNLKIIKIGITIYLCFLHNLTHIHDIIYAYIGNIKLYNIFIYIYIYIYILNLFL